MPARLLSAASPADPAACVRAFAAHRAVRFSSVFACACVSALLAAASAAQEMTFDQLRESALDAMSGMDVERLELAGAGWDACLGQAWNVNEGWARWEIRDYRRIIDYAEIESLQTAMRRAAMDPERIGGCGAQPGAEPTRQQSRVDGNSPWPDQLPIWLTPHGFLRLAEREDASIAAEGDGWNVSVRVPRGEIVYTVNGHYDEDFLLERIETWIDDSVFGDMKVEAEFDDYRRFGSLLFPESWVYKQGGFTTLDLTLDGVVPNTDAETSVPSGSARFGGGRGAPAGNEEPYVEIGEGVFVMLGAYQSVAVELDEFAVVIDGLQNDNRSRELIRLTNEAIPGKEIRYVVTTHSHFDHASGLRAFADEGATVVTHAANVEFFERALAAPRTLSTDESLNRPARPVDVQGVDGRLVISDDSGRSVELHALEGGAHADDMLVAYLPAIGTIVEADSLQPWINPVFGGGDHPFLVHLYEELERLGLDYRQFVPVHRPPEPPTMPKAVLVEAVGR